MASCRAANGRVCRWARCFRKRACVPTGRWLLAEGADAAAMSRSVPIDKAFDDALIAIYQNGERLRPENGYPMRLLLPGWEGNTSVKWLRRLKVTDAPVMTKDETSKYTDSLPDGRAMQFTFPMGVKSVITSPSGGLKHARARAVSDFRHRVVRRRPGPSRRRVCRWRQDVGACRHFRSGAAQGVDAIPHGVALGRRVLRC